MEKGKGRLLLIIVATVMICLYMININNNFNDMILLEKSPICDKSNSLNNINGNIQINNLQNLNCISKIQYDNKELIKLSLLRESFFDVINIIFLVFIILLLWTNERINKDSKEYISLFGNK